MTGEGTSFTGTGITTDGAITIMTAGAAVNSMDNASFTVNAGFKRNMSSAAGENSTETAKALMVTAGMARAVEDADN